MIRRLERLGLRARVFLLFVPVALAPPLLVGAGLGWALREGAEGAAIGEEARLRLALTCALAGALLAGLLALWVWQLFDRYVAAALQRLARELETAICLGTEAALDDESLRYLDPVVPAVRRALAAREAAAEGTAGGAGTAEGARASGPGAVAGPDRRTRAEHGLADILDRLDVGIVAFGPDRRVLLHNARARELVAGAGGTLGLGRPVGDALGGEALPEALERLDGADPCGPLARGRGVALELRAPDGAAADVPAARTVAPVRFEATLVGLAAPDGTRGGGVLSFGRAAPETAAQAPPDGGTDRVEGGAGPATDALGSALVERPHCYDFDLFEREVPAAVAAARLAALDYVVFDTETTGLEPSAGDRIVSIAAVRVVNGRVLHAEAFARTVDPGRPIPAAATRVHGLSDADVVGCPPIETVLPGFLRFVGEAVPVAHNAAFDLAFLAPALDACGASLEAPVLDTVLLSSFLHDHESDHTLDALARRLGVEVSGRHTALGDALVTAEVFARQLRLLEARGVSSLGRALSVSEAQAGIRRAQRAY